MEYNFTKMSQTQAENIATNWHYEGEYSFYNFEEDEEDLSELLSPIDRGDNYYIVKKDKEEVGFFYFDKQGDSVVIGLGMKPELTGRGRGTEFLKAGMSYAISTFNPKEIKLAVATFNERAIKVYQKAGFEKIGTYMQDTNGTRVEFLNMKYVCQRRQL